MTITDYKLIQAEGNKALQAEVERFIKDGWAPHGAPFIVGTKQMSDAKVIRGVVIGPTIRIFAQAIVKREPEHAELQRLRDIEERVHQIAVQLDNPLAGDGTMLVFAHEELEKSLRGGRWERK